MNKEIKIKIRKPKQQVEDETKEIEENKEKENKEEETEEEETKPETEKTIDEIKEEKEVTNFKLGDIIKIISPTNQYYDQNSYFIEYIDDEIIEIIHISTLSKSKLNLNEDGFLTDESITSIILLNRSNEEGYARQHGLLPHKWVDIDIGGDYPAHIIGEITNLEEDMIEVKTAIAPRRLLYIDFAYKGLPRDIPFKTFTIREKPKDIEYEEVELDEYCARPEDEKAYSEYSDSGEMIINIPENAVSDEVLKDKLKREYHDADELIFGDELENVVQMVEISEREKNYSLDIQANDLKDELLSTIPNNKRTKKVLDHVQRLIERYKQLRNIYSVFDDNMNVLREVYKGVQYKPLIEKIKNNKFDLKWLVPVVTQKKRLFNDDFNTGITHEDVINASLENDLNHYQDCMMRYKNIATNNRYLELYRDLDKIMNPFEAMGFDNSENYKKNMDDLTQRYLSSSLITNFEIEKQEKDSKYLIEKETIQNEMDVIVDNYGDFNCKVENKEDTEKQFFVQRYNLGLKKKEATITNSGRTAFVHSNLTKDDKMTLKSLILLPQTMVKYSQIDLPGTNIMRKSELSKNIFSFNDLFNNDIKIPTHIVDDLDHEILYEEDGDFTFLNKIKHYVLDEELINEPNKFSKFMNVIIPDTRTIIKNMKKSINKKMSFVNVVKELQPFGIYENDICYGQLNEIRHFIKTQIQEFNDTYNDRKRNFKRLFNQTGETSVPMNKIEKMFFDNKETMDMFRDGYKMGETNLKNISTSELLSTLTKIDGCNLLCNIIASITIKKLTTPEDILKIFEPANIDDMSDGEKIKPKDCVRRYLTKKYKNFKELQNDQHKDEIYYDDEFDDTPYHIMKLYENDQKTMAPDEFKEFLTENLLTKHGVEQKHVEELVETLILGKKLVKDGEYAILQVKPKLPSNVNEEQLTKEEKKQMKIEEEIREKTGYYYRVKDQWIFDKNIEPEMFIDTNTLFCNIRPDCFKNESADSLLNSCEPKDQAKKRMEQLTKSRMLKEFDNRINMTLEELTKKMKTQLTKDFKKIHSLSLIRENQTNKYNNKAYELSKFADEVDGIQSKHIELRDTILTQDDFVKKQSDILKFIELVCREPMQDVGIVENQYWYYCKDTNTKLLPMFFGTLANAYMQNKYNEALDNICATKGTLSDDGDYIVDEESGFNIRKRDYVVEDEYTKEGFKVSHYDIMEKELQVKMTDAQKSKPVFENEINEVIYNILYSICDNIGLETSRVKDFVLRVTEELMRVNIVSENAYKKQAESYLKETGKNKISYEIYKNRIMFWNIAATLLVAIQTTTDETFKINKTFTNCKRSFSGYPLTGIEDQSGIIYLSCVMKAMKSKEEPWNSIEKVKEEQYVTNIKGVIEQFLYKRNDIVNLYDVKREYLLTHPEENIPESHDVKKWKSFLPPIVPFKVGSIRSITKEFKDELIEELRNGSKEQRESFSIIKSRLSLYGYGLVELINNIIKKKDPLLKTISKNPFIENACCNDNNASVLNYFIKENDNIKKIMITSKELNDFVNEIKTYSTARLLFHNEFTGIKQPVIGETILEENVYYTFIKYCNLNNDMPIPEKFMHIFSSKFEEYPTNGSIHDQIEFLKKNGKHFSENDLHLFLRLIHSEKTIHIQHDLNYDTKSALTDILEKFDSIDSSVIDKNFRDHLTKILHNYDPKKMTNESEDLNNFKNFLANANEQLYYAIVDFFDDYGNLTDRQFDKLQDYLLNVTTTQLDNKDAIYNVTNFMKNAIYNMTKLFPSILTNKDGVGYKNVPQHWDISKNHRFDISNMLNNYWNVINSNINANEALIKSILNDVNGKLSDLYLFIHHLPIHMYFEKDKETFFSLFDKDAIYLLYIYLYYSCIYEYILSANDKEHLKSDIKEKKQFRKESIQNDKNDAQQLVGANETNEELVEMETILVGNQEDFKKSIARLLLAFMQMEKNDTFVLSSYNEFFRKSKKIEIKEKETMVQELGNITDNFERKLEEYLLKFKIGKYNIGLSKSLTQYNKDHYDKERENVSIGMQEIDVEDDYRNGEEALELEHLGEDYMDGDPEGDYREEENEFGDF